MHAHARREARTRTSIRCALLATVIVFVSGCSTISRITEKSEEIPELEELEPTAEISTAWSRNVGADHDRQYLRLRPFVADAVVYAAGPEGDIAAVESASGDVLWRTDTDARISGGVHVIDGLVVVGTLDGEVIALSAADGTERWRARVSSEVLASPSGDGDVLVVRTIDGKLYGLSAPDGQQRWVYDRTVPALTLRGTSAPIVVGNLVIAGFDSGRLVALDLREGRTFWESRVSVPRGKTELERIVDIDAEPIVIDDIVYAVTFQGQLVAVDLSSGEILWRRDLSSFVGISADLDHLYVTDDQSVIWALDRSSGRSLWRQESLTKRHVTNATVFGPYLAVGDVEGYIHILDRVDGVIVARVEIDSDGFTTAPVVDGQHLIAHGRGGTLAAITVGE